MRIIYAYLLHDDFESAASVQLDWFVFDIFQKMAGGTTIRNIEFTEK